MYPVGAKICTCFDLVVLNPVTTSNLSLTEFSTNSFQDVAIFANSYQRSVTRFRFPPESNFLVLSSVLAVDEVILSGKIYNYTPDFQYPIRVLRIEGDCEFTRKMMPNNSSTVVVASRKKWSEDMRDLEGVRLFTPKQFRQRNKHRI